MTTDTLIGRPVANCIVERKLGAGGMGAVYLATHQTLGKHVAIKVLPASPPPPEQFVERFFREARAMAQLEHNNIVGVSDVGQQDDFYYIVMQYVEGMPLERLVIDHGPLPIGRALAVIRDCAAAMAHAHSKGILHRDIKPDNIIIQKDGSVKMLDFGLAKLDGNESVALTLTGQIMGTPMYMAPEQAEGKPADHRTDIYSLGATGFYILTADYPFTGRSGMDILLKKVKEDPRDILSLRRDLPPAVGQLINKMMGREPEKRFQSMQRVVEILDRALAARAAAGQASAPAHAAPQATPQATHQPQHPTAGRPAQPQKPQPSAQAQPQPAGGGNALPDPRALLSGQAQPPALQKQSVQGHAQAQAELPDPRALLSGAGRRIQDEETRPIPAENPATLLGVSGMQPTAVDGGPQVDIPAPIDDSGPVLDVTLQVGAADVAAEAQAVPTAQAKSALPPTGLATKPTAGAAQAPGARQRAQALADDRPTIDLSAHRVQNRPGRRQAGRGAGVKDGGDGDGGSRTVMLVLVAAVVLIGLVVGGYALYITYIAPAANNDTNADNTNGSARNNAPRIVDDNNGNVGANGSNNTAGNANNAVAEVERPDEAVLQAYASGLSSDARTRREGYHVQVEEHLLGLRPFQAGAVLRRVIREFTGDPLIPYLDAQVRGSLKRNKFSAYRPAFEQMRSLIDAGPLRWQEAADLARALEADAPDNIDRRLLSDIAFEAIKRATAVHCTLIPFGGADFDDIVASRSSSYMVDRYEVTVGEYAVFLYDSGHGAPGGLNPRQASSRAPVTNVNADDARAYAAWARGRLPEQTEFELLARGRSGFDWEDHAGGLVMASNGARAPVEVDVAWPQWYVTTPWGTPHIVGNVREWVDTTDGAVPMGASYADRRDEMATLTSPPAGFQGERIGREDTGFRIVYDLPSAANYPRERDAAYDALERGLQRAVDSQQTTLLEAVTVSERCQAMLDNIGLGAPALVRLVSPGTELLTADINDFTLSTCGSAAYAEVTMRIRYNRFPQRIHTRLIITRTLREDQEWVLDHIEAELGRGD